VIAVRQDDVLELTCALLSGMELPPPADPVVWTATDGGGGDDVLLASQDGDGRAGDDLLYYAVASLPAYRVERRKQHPAADSEESSLSPRQQLTCRSGSQAVSVQLDVEFQPEFTISRSPGFGVPISEDMNVSLKCSVEANPLASPPFWEHNGIRLLGSPLDGFATESDDLTVAELRFEAIREESEGWYQCSAEHKFGNFSSVGYYLSVKPSRSSFAETAVGAAAVPGGLSSSLGGPGGGGSAEAGQRRTTSSQLADQVLLVERSGLAPARQQQQQTGCGWPGEVAGEEDGHLRPTVTPERKIMSAAEGEAVHLRMEFCSDTLDPNRRVVWSGPQNLLLAPGQASTRWRALALRDATLRAGCHVAELAGMPVRQEDTGLYLLVVVTGGGDQGVAAGRVALHVTSHPAVASGAILFVNVCESLDPIPIVLVVLFIQQYVGRTLN
jgi:hypothetical protein